MLGGAWPERVEAAYHAMEGEAAADEVDEGPGVLLLRDMAEVMAAPGREQMRSSALCAALNALEDAPWSEWRRGGPITTRGVAMLLRPFGIAPVQDREGSYYRRSAFRDALERYGPRAPR